MKTRVRITILLLLSIMAVSAPAAMPVPIPVTDGVVYATVDAAVAAMSLKTTDGTFKDRDGRKHRVYLGLENKVYYLKPVKGGFAVIEIKSNC